MKKMAAGLLFFSYLFATTEASQLLKLPVIIQHFREHRQQNKDISFFEFLDMHYMHGSPKDQDYNRDMQLPFKKTNHHLVTSPVTEPRFLFVPEPVPIAFKRQSFIIRNEDSAIPQHRPDIFQPPRAWAVVFS